MLLEQVWAREVAEAALADVELVLVTRDVADETREVFNPREVPIPVEQIDRHRRVRQLCDVERISAASLIIEKRENVYADADLLFDLGHRARLDRIFDSGEAVLLEEGREGSSPAMTGRICRLMQRRHNCVAEAALIVILHVNDAFLVRKKCWQLLKSGASEWTKSCYAERRDADVAKYCLRAAAYVVRVSLNDLVEHAGQMTVDLELI